MWGINGGFNGVFQSVAELHHHHHHQTCETELWCSSYRCLQITWNTNSSRLSVSFSECRDSFAIQNVKSLNFHKCEPVFGSPWYIQTLPENLPSLFTWQNAPRSPDWRDYLTTASADILCFNLTFIQVVSLWHELIIRANVQYVHQHLRHCGGENNWQFSLVTVLCDNDWLLFGFLFESRAESLHQVLLSSTDINSLISWGVMGS